VWVPCGALPAGGWLPSGAPSGSDRQSGALIFIPRLRPAVNLKKKMSGKLRPSLLSTGARLAEHWVVQKRIGRGAFGDVFLATHEITGEQCAVKAEVEASPRLQREAAAYTILHARLGRAPGIPLMHWTGGGVGASGQPVQLLSMELLGTSLEDARRALGGTLPVHMLARLGRDMLRRIETVHASGIVHCDLKPANFLLPAGALGMGGADARSLGRTPLRAYLIDFGFARSHGGGPSPTEALRPPPLRRGIVGSARFSSIRNHQLHPLAPRDDIEALAYTLAYLGTGTLPWVAIGSPSVDSRTTEGGAPNGSGGGGAADLARRIGETEGGGEVGRRAGETDAAYDKRSEAAYEKRKRFARILERKLAAHPEEIASGLPDGFAELVSYARALQPVRRICLISSYIYLSISTSISG